MKPIERKEMEHRVECILAGMKAVAITDLDRIQPIEEPIEGRIVVCNMLAIGVENSARLQRAFLSNTGAQSQWVLSAAGLPLLAGALMLPTRICEELRAKASGLIVPGGVNGFSS